MNGPNQDDYLTTFEVAAMLRLSPGTLRNRRSKGLAPHGFKLAGGNRILYSRQEIEALLRSPEPERTPETNANPVDLPTGRRKRGRPRKHPVPEAK